MSHDIKQQGSVQHKCPNCGASLHYDAASGRLHCNHCKGFVDFDKDNFVVERDFSELYTTDKWKPADVAGYRCHNCGAVSVTPRTTLATLCPYCNSPVVIEDETGSIVKPDTIIPFEVPPDVAARELTHWRKKRFWSPSKFKKITEAEGIRGVYLPVWTFDADTQTNYNGRLGRRRTRTVRRGGKTYTETYTEWFTVSGTMPAAFDDIVIRANDHLTDDEFRVLEPLDQRRYMAFDDEYLAGYIADHYTLSPQEAFSRAKAKMLSVIRQRIISYYNADVEGHLNLDLQINKRSFKYLFAPVYIAATKYQGKLYRQYVSGVYNNRNAQTCKIRGTAPRSKLKIALAVLLALGVAVGLGFLAYFLWKKGSVQGPDDWGVLSAYLRQGVDLLKGGR